MKITPIILAAFVLTCAHAYADDFSSVKYTESSNSITLTDASGGTKQCTLQTKLKDVSPKFNWNKKIILLTDTAYSTTSDITECRDGKISPSRIPDHVGFVVDVNLKKNIYLSLDVITAGPSSYIATVAKLGDKRPLASFSGMYDSRKSMSKLQEEGFDYNESAPGGYRPTGDTLAQMGQWNVQSTHSPVYGICKPKEDR